MAENSKIEWCDHTVNFWWGCKEVSRACANCYARTLAKRFHHRADGSDALWGPDSGRWIRIAEAREEAMRYQRRAAQEGRRFRVFTNSMSDFFEDRRDLDEPRLLALQVMRETPDLDWLILTKRPERIVDGLHRACVDAEPPPRHPAFFRWLKAWLDGEAPANVWLGTTVEDQARADQRVPALLRAPAAVRFLSCEPLLGPVDLTGRGLVKGWCPTHDFPGGFCHGACPDDRRLDWIIAGGESGYGARPSHPDWFRSLRDQCSAEGVPFLLKQLGEWGPSAVRMDSGQPVYRVFRDFQHWDAKGYTWMTKGDLVLDAHGERCNTAGDLMRGQAPFTVLRKIGRKAAGRLLDGMEHNGYPEVRR